jgi:hypothetical protein
MDQILQWPVVRPVAICEIKPAIAVSAKGADALGVKGKLIEERRAAGGAEEFRVERFSRAKTAFADGNPGEPG